METINVQVTEEMIRVGIEKAISDSLKDSYRNPIKTAVEASIQANEGAIKKVVDEIIVSAISNVDFKDKISSMVIARMVESALKK